MTQSTALFENNEVTLLDLALIVAKRKRIIVFGTLFFILLAIIANFTMKPAYQAEAKILIPQSASSGSAMLSQIAGAGAAGIVGGMLGLGSSASMYYGLVKSRAIVDALIDTHNLCESYAKDRVFPLSLLPYTRDDCRDKVLSILSPQLDTESGIITIDLEDSGPKRVAGMANTVVDELLKLNMKLVMAEASQRRAFYDGELRKAHEALSKSEDEVRQFQERSGAIQIEDQARAILDGIATLEAQIAAKEIQIKVMKTYATPMNPDLKRTQEELAGLKEQRRRLEEKNATYNPAGQTSQGNVIIPTAEIPSLGTDYLRKMREFKYQETLYLLLLKQYEVARLDEAKDPGVIQVVDRGVVPEKKVRPKLILMLVASTFVGFFFSVFAAFLLEYLKRTSNDPSSRVKWRNLLWHIRRV